MVAFIELCKIGILVFLACLLTTSSQASIVAVHPKNATVVNGGDIVLNCKFNEIIDKCVWIRNGSTIKINDRYKYYNSSMNGTKTDDCSIEISNFSHIDVTHWHCTCAGDSNPNTTKYEQCKSNFAYLSMNTSDETTEEETNATLNDLLISNTTVVNHPENATVFEGSRVVMKCKFNETIKCVWFRNGTAVTIKDRYRYLNYTINGQDSSNCSIEINQMNKIDATHWQCACSVDSNLPNATCKSNFAHLTLDKSNATTESTTSTTKASDLTSTSTVEATKETLILGLPMTNFLLFVVIGLLLGAILFSTIVYCACRHNAKIKQNLKSSVALTELPSNLIRHESSPNMDQSTESVCTLCHQHKPEPCSSGGVWSAPYYECRDKFLSLPEVTEQLPSYEEANLRHDEPLEKLYEEMPIRESCGHYMYIDEFKQQEPEKSLTMTNASESTEVNPLYDEVPTHGTSETEVDDGSNEIERFEMGCKDVLYTRVQPKTKTQDKPTN